MFFLATLDPLLKPGTIIFFDNFSVATHDFRAFVDYTDSFARSFSVIGTAEYDNENIAIRIDS